MRRRVAALAALVLATTLAFANPFAAQADQETCDNRRIAVMTGTKFVAYDPNSETCLAGQNVRRILPGADHAALRIFREDEQAHPALVVVTTDSKTIEVEVASDTGEPETGSEFDSEFFPIGSTSKVHVKVSFADGTESAVLYTR